MDRYFFDVIFDRSIFNDCAAAAHSKRFGGYMKHIFVAGAFVTFTLSHVPAVEPTQQQMSVAIQQPKVSAKLWQEVRSAGTVRIIVMFNLNRESLRNLGKEEQIAAAQDMLLGELAGTKFKVTGRFRHVEGMGLYVDPQGLSIIERTPLVEKVNEVTPDRAS